MTLVYQKLACWQSCHFTFSVFLNSARFFSHVHLFLRGSHVHLYWQSMGDQSFTPAAQGPFFSFCFNLFCFGSSICVTANMAKFFLSLWLIIAKGIKLFPTLSSASRLHVQHPYKQENSANYKIKKRFMVVNATRNSLNLSSNQVKHGQNSRLFFLTCTTAPSEFRFKCLSIQPPSCIVEQRSSEHRRASSRSWIPEQRWASTAIPKCSVSAQPSRLTRWIPCC